MMVMSGSGAAGGVSRQITGGGSATTTILDNTVGFANSDLRWSVKVAWSIA